jgi:hypothetical protein
LARQVFGDGDDGIQRGESVVAAGAGAASLHPSDRFGRAVLNWLVGQPVDHLVGLSGNVGI